MNEEEKNIQREMYTKYGIAEWFEKCLVLNDIERESIKSNLENGLNTALVALAKLPYPLFVRAYLSRFPAAEHYLSDPAFGYKLFLMSEPSTKILCETIRNPDITGAELEKKYKRKSFDRMEVSEFMNTPLDMLPKILSPDSNFKPIWLKYLYLTQYIDYEEAKKLGISFASVLERDRASGAQYDGYELEDKLKLLNPASRLIICKLLGLFGHTRMTIRDIVKEYGLADYKVRTLFNELFPSLLLTIGDFKNKVGYIEREYEPGEAKEYSNRKFRALDLDIQVKFIVNNVLSDSERLVLESMSNSEVAFYVAYKYLYHDKKKTMDSLVMDISDIDIDNSFGGL